MRAQLVVTASIACLTRNSRATISITDTLPPCEVTITSFLMPARKTDVPISIQLLVAVSQERDSVPGKSMCSSDLPTD
jgi:hypothetical protein